MSRSSARLSILAAAAWLGPGRIVDDAAVVIEGSRVIWAGAATEAPPADDELAGDWFLVPGIADHHVHIRFAEPRDVLLGGVTLARDLGWPPDDVFPLADISEATDFDGPVVVAAGPMITAAGGYPSRAAWAPAGTALEVRGTEEAAAAVGHIATQDPAAIKVALNADAGPTLTDAELVAICEAAHARDLRVTAHPQGAGQAERALGAGIDELAHCPWTERLSDDLVQALARRVTIVSTLDIHSYGVRTPELETAVDNLRRFAAAGGTVRYGTDLGNGAIPPGVHGGEIVHLAAAGLTPEAILRAMSPGAPGSVVGLRSSPMDDPEALADVGLVVRSGRVHRLDRTA